MRKILTAGLVLFSLSAHGQGLYLDPYYSAHQMINPSGNPALAHPNDILRNQQNSSANLLIRELNSLERDAAIDRAIRSEIRRDRYND